MACDAGACCESLFEPTLDPREFQSSCRCARPGFGQGSLKAGAGHPPIQGVQGLVTHGEADFLRFVFGGGFQDQNMNTERTEKVRRAQKGNI